jgi:hypothetical protein
MAGRIAALTEDRIGGILDRVRMDLDLLDASGDGGSIAFGLRQRAQQLHALIQEMRQ